MRVTVRERAVHQSIILRPPQVPPYHFSLLKYERCISTAPDVVPLLNLCSNVKHLYQTHGFMVRRGLDRDNLLLGRFIDACSSLGFSDYGYSVFTHKTHQQGNDIYLFNTAIRALSRSPTHSPKDAILLYSGIQVAGLRPDAYSLPFVLKAVVRLSAVEVGREIHCQALGTGLELDVHVATALIQMYSTCGCVSDARKLFDEVSVRDVTLWNAMVAGYAKGGDADNARDLFEHMPDRNVISWTAMIAGYAKMDRSGEAIAMFRRMQLEDVQPDGITLLVMLSACAHLGALELGKWIHSYADKHGFSRRIQLNNALIDMYAKLGKLNKALEVFENMEHRSVITWTTMIDGLALHGLGKEAVDMFSRMESAGVKPNAVTFISILSACSHVGLVEIGLGYFNSMGSKYGIKPTIEHYGCMIDLLGRAGYLRKALELVRVMPFEANGAIWGSLLAASRIYGNAELAEHALQHLAKVEPYNGGNYMLLSNIYAARGWWTEVGVVRKEMRDKGIKKTPGGSFIEVNNKVHEFIAGDRSHPKSTRIYEVLGKINWQLKMAGFVQMECEMDA
ncbi:pentatricopeptide repeat-containing protein At5g56310 [Malania oleifera]|uniref:pentatricopeptide repeat-containing protein At5g56310 n=1 Tax=Malania oleifera TaxID=397392 RepID=UPI0025ADB76D|nr:pentatricopeptide repeat-containing protein At5g56310 [Malania oleifera]